ncbi:hypothetical protein [Pseudodesulfovibrio portus]|uniref:hypothetical protein n=1 Tax=Pseudodesulfovibrio portus TaxID=231439 RepID=UPI002230FE0D|nr:hypothetical protein [Pseudodesulfovibrio portus]
MAFFEKGLLPAPVSEEEMELLSQGRPLSAPLEGNIFLKMMGAGEIVNLDVLPHSPFAYIHDLGKPIPEELKGKARFVFDGTTGYHVMDRCTALCNAANLLQVGGILIHTFTMNPLSPTFNSFNPQLLLRFYETNGFGNFQLHAADRGHTNSVYKACGDLHHSTYLPDLTRYVYIFSATKEEDVPVTTDSLEWQYELHRCAGSEESVDPARLAGKTVAIWGTGGNYADNYAGLPASKDAGFDFWGFVDGDSGKWGSEVDGHVVRDPASLRHADVDVVVIASWAREEIFDALSSILQSKPEVLANTYGLYRGFFERKKLIKTLQMSRLSNSVIEPHTLKGLAG